MFRLLTVLLLAASVTSAQNHVHVPELTRLRHRQPPIPGGIGAGDTYAAGQFQVTTFTQLDTEMVVYPQGLKLPANWMFTTATNRSDLGVEFAGIYYGNRKGALGVFDWSCSAGNPCTSPDGTVNTGPAWIWTDNLSPRFNCNTYSQSVVGFNLSFVHYRNQTSAITGGWQNTVQLWNACLNQWEMVYTHTYTAQQRDCSLDATTCGWWGPIIETFFTGQQPALKKLGFLNSTITLNSTSQLLMPPTTNWTPPPFEWLTYTLQPNHTWIVGSRQ